MADYFPLLSRTIASLGNSTPEQRQIVYERARSVVADQLSAIEPPMDSEAIKRELSLFEASVMRLEHEMQSLEAIKPVPLPGETETRKHISARLSALLAKAAAARAATTQDLLTRDIEPSTRMDGDLSTPPDPAPSSHITPRVGVETVPEPVSRVAVRPSAPMEPQVVERKPAMPSIADAPNFETPKFAPPHSDAAIEGPEPSPAAAPLSGQPASKAGEDEAPVPAPLDAGPSAFQSESDPISADITGETAPLAIPDAQPDPMSLPQAAAPRGSLSQLLLKAQDFWHKKPSSPEPAPPAIVPDEAGVPDSVPQGVAPQGVISQGVIPQDMAPQEAGQPALFPQDRLSSPALAARESAQPAFSTGVLDEEFVGPVQPAAVLFELQSEDSASGTVAASTDIVFSDDVAPVPDDRQGELPLLLPPNSAPSKPAPASEIELLDDGRPRLAQRRKRDRGLFRGLVMGLAFVSVIAAVAGAAWVLRDRPADFEQSATATRGDLSRKITDRLPSEAVVASTQTAEQLATGGAGVAASGQRVMLFEEGVEGQPEPVPVKGRVTWALETIRDQTGAGDVAIKADIRDLSGSLSAVTMVIKRNRDIGFPASHLIELSFATPDNSPNGRVRDIGTPEMRAEEGVRGTSLSGLPVPVTENVFLVGLTNLPDRIEQNRELLRNRNWIVIPMRFANGRRAVMMVEKGLVGDRVLLDAFQAWK